MVNDAEAYTSANPAREWAARAIVACFGAAALFWALGISGALVMVFAFCAPQRWVRFGVNLM